MFYEFGMIKQCYVLKITVCNGTILFGTVWNLVRRKFERKTVEYFYSSLIIGLIIKIFLVYSLTIKENYILKKYC